MRLLNATALSALVIATSSVAALANDVEPTLKLEVKDVGARTVALTFDACAGEIDHRILDALIDSDAKATIFVTERWLKRNQAALATLKAHPDLFQIENHGAKHVPAITDRPTVFGLKTAGSIEAVRAEVEGGATAVERATGAKPRWFRGASARYSHDAVAEIEAEGYRVAGYSLNADMGASLPAKTVARRIEAARSGDVIIAHINQPTHPSGAGVADGVRALAAEGAIFVKLDDLPTKGDEDRGMIVSRKDGVRSYPKEELRPRATPAACPDCAPPPAAQPSDHDAILPDLPPPVSVDEGEIGAGRHADEPRP